jgi:acetyl esterase/lipase
LYSSLRRFQRAYSTPGLEFAAFIPFYAPCNRRFINEDDVSDRPIRLFHGNDDDWSRITYCRQYAEHARSRGRDVQLFEFENAGHGFDVPNWEQGYDAQAENPGGCIFEERPEGLMVNDQPLMRSGNLVRLPVRPIARARPARRAPVSAGCSARPFFEESGRGRDQGYNRPCRA